jgi:purine nucleosidase
LTLVPLLLRLRISPPVPRGPARHESAVALDPDIVETRSATVDVELTGTLTRGMTIADWSGRWGRKPNAQNGVGVDPAAFFERFIDRVGPFARRLA